MAINKSITLHESKVDSFIEQIEKDTIEQRSTVAVIDYTWQEVPNYIELDLIVYNELELSKIITQLNTQVY